MEQSFFETLTYLGLLTIFPLQIRIATEAIVGPSIRLKLTHYLRKSCIFKNTGKIRL